MAKPSGFWTRGLLRVSTAITSSRSTRVVSGDLWIGTVDGGLFRLENGVATTYTDRDGLPSRIDQLDPRRCRRQASGSTRRGSSSFCRREVGGLPHSRGKAVSEFLLTGAGRKHVVPLRSGPRAFRRRWLHRDLARPQAEAFLVQEARDGSVWVAFRDEYRLVRYSQGVFSDMPLPRPCAMAARSLDVARYPRVSVLAMARDTDGELLLLTPAGLVRVVDGKAQSSRSHYRYLPTPANCPRCAASWWIAKAIAGLERLGRGWFVSGRAPLTAYGKDEGLSDSASCRVSGSRGPHLAGRRCCLYWFDGHRFHLVPGVADIRAIAQTRDGDLWFGGSGGLYRWRSGVLSRFKMEVASREIQIYQDREGTLWIVAASTSAGRALPLS